MKKFFVIFGMLSTLVIQPSAQADSSPSASDSSRTAAALELEVKDAPIEVKDHKLELHLGGFGDSKGGANGATAGFKLRKLYAERPTSFGYGKYNPVANLDLGVEGRIDYDKQSGQAQRLELKGPTLGAGSQTIDRMSDGEATATGKYNLFELGMFYDLNRQLEASTAVVRGSAFTTMSAEKGFSISGIPMRICGALDVFNVGVGRIKILDQKKNFAWIPSVSGCFGVKLGDHIGEIAYNAGVQAVADFDGSGTIEAYQTVALNKLLGSPMSVSGSAEYGYSKSGGDDGDSRTSPTRYMIRAEAAF